MSILPPLSGLPIKEAMRLAERAVEALERQAALMTDPEPDEKITQENMQEQLRIANGMGFRESRIFFGQKLQDILDAGYSESERARKLRDLSNTMNSLKAKKK